MKFIRKLNKLGKWYKPQYFAPVASMAYEQNPKFEKIPDIELNRDKYDMISFEMIPFDLLAFRGLMVHGSVRNISKDRRRWGSAC